MFQRQVFPQPRTGRETVWQIQFYRPSDLAPFYQGSVHGIEGVKKAIRLNKRDGIITRVIGPIDAPQNEIEELRTLGATQTFP